MVPESPSVCFRCKMCKVCFLTMNEIERHLQATNHYIRPSSNSNSSTTKEKSTANESSDDKPLNLSSKSVFSPRPPSKRPDELDLTLSSGGDSAKKDDTNAKGVNVSVKADKVVQEPKGVSSRKASEEGSPLIQNSICMKDSTHDDLADVETDTVSSTSSDPSPSLDKPISPLTPPSPKIVEVSVSTHSLQLNEKKPKDFGEKAIGADPKDVSKGKEMANNTEICTKAQCDEIAMKDSAPRIVDGKEKTATETLPSPVAVAEEKERLVEKRISEDCEMSTNENDEPRAPSGEKAAPKSKPISQSQSKKKKQKHKYKCKHCGDLFKFPVQVHMHMLKVHPSSEESPKPPTRRVSINTAANNNNNNNNDTAKVNVQMYPLRSLYARAKRRTRSMQSDGGSGAGTRRNSLGQNLEDKKEKKSARKITHFTCKHCGKKFPLLNQLKIHLHKVHPEKVKKSEGTLNGGGVRKRKHLASRRLVIASKRRKTTPLVVQPQNRSLRVSTRSASRSAESEPETVRMSTRRRSSVARSEKSSILGSTASSRRSSTKRELERNAGMVKIEPKVGMESDEEKIVEAEKGKRKARHSSSSTKKSLVYESEAMDVDQEETTGEEKPEVKAMQTPETDDTEESTIYNDSDCMIIDTVETILYALTSKRSQTCPNCNKYCKFAGNFKLHLKACMNLDDDLEQLPDDDGSGRLKPSPVKIEMEEDDAETDGEMGEEEEEQESESNEENEDESSAIPYYQKLDYRRCWECGFIVSKFHNLSRHLKQRHNISMGTKQMHAKQAEILRLK